MTTRRPARALFGFELNHVQEDPVHRSSRNEQSKPQAAAEPTNTTTGFLHPTLTDFGPQTATKYFKAACPSFYFDADGFRTNTRTASAPARQTRSRSAESLRIRQHDSSKYYQNEQCKDGNTTWDNSNTGLVGRLLPDLQGTLSRTSRQVSSQCGKKRKRGSSEEATMDCGGGNDTGYDSPTETSHDSHALIVPSPIAAEHSGTRKGSFTSFTSNSAGCAVQVMNGPLLAPLNTTHPDSLPQLEPLSSTSNGTCPHCPVSPKVDGLDPSAQSFSIPKPSRCPDDGVISPPDVTSTEHHCTGPMRNVHTDDNGAHVPLIRSSPGTSLYAPFDYATYFGNHILPPSKNTSEESAVRVVTKKKGNSAGNPRARKKIMPHKASSSQGRKPQALPPHSTTITLDSSNERTTVWPPNVPQDIFREITKFLSFDDVNNLRLVNRDFSNQLRDVRFRSVVVPFGNGLFEPETSKEQAATQLPPTSTHAMPRDAFNKFGISFEVDMNSLMHAVSKPFSQEENAWWGSFAWPEGHYRRYPALQQLEDLADSPVLLRAVLEGLSNTTELGLSIDSGHGWLNGVDLSDLEVWNMRCRKSDVFGPNFPQEDVWHRYGKEQIFRAGQQNTIDYMVKVLDRAARDEFLPKVPIRPLESFIHQVSQPDHDLNHHIGGPFANLDPLMALMHREILLRGDQNSTEVSDLDGPPQYPIIFNGFNLAAEITGEYRDILDDLLDAEGYPLKPGSLTEPQAQWLLETYWAQKAFLASYVTSVIHNRPSLSQVHSLHLSKISSGLLDSLRHREFWKALSGLHTITLLVIPDWRRSHEPGDSAFNENMLIQPIGASIKLACLLRDHIASLENLSNLHVGFVGGGEHAKGLFARNQHVLPAPLTTDPKAWLLHNSSQTGGPSLSTMISLEHVQRLTIVNAWLSPSMLRNWMLASRDTSLKHLILDSVSMAVPHSSVQVQAPTPFHQRFKPRYSARRWIQEVTPSVPDACVWVKIIDKITPGLTLEQHRLASGLIDEKNYVPRDFVGNISKITFKSCGYVKISGLSILDGSDYNQDLLATPTHNPMDRALDKRRSKMSLAGVMLKNVDAAGHEFPLLGRITQCLHPIEKRVLERGYGFKFGWANDLSRWESVEDGCFEGGTGRFSGTISKDVSTPATLPKLTKKTAAEPKNLRKRKM